MVATAATTLAVRRPAWCGVVYPVCQVGACACTGGYMGACTGVYVISGISGISVLLYGIIISQISQISQNGTLEYMPN